jgi:hypothetical protein
VTGAILCTGRQRTARLVSISQLLVEELPMDSQGWIGAEHVLYAG